MRTKHSTSEGTQLWDVHAAGLDVDPHSTRVSTVIRRNLDWLDLSVQHRVGSPLK